MGFNSAFKVLNKKVGLEVLEKS